MDWMKFTGAEALPSPMLILHWNRVEENLQRMIACVGDVNRLRPHLKTHKLGRIARRKVELGIRKCKVATIAEAQMAADAGMHEITLSMQPVGPNVDRFVRLMQTYPASQFSTLCDHPHALDHIASTANRHGVEIELLIDVNIGQNRTGTPPEAAAALYATIAATRGVRCGGIHAYDGHIQFPAPDARKQACETAFEPVWRLRDSVLRLGFPVPRIVAGGSPTFPIHAQNPEVECSPGTTVLWDAGSISRFPEMHFLPAAVLLTRVVSLPAPDSICLDLGYKSVSSEIAHPRVVFPELPDAKAVTHNEEHLVLQLGQAHGFEPGHAFFGIPWHVCPSVALHNEAAIIRDGAFEEIIPITARGRRLTL